MPLDAPVMKASGAVIALSLRRARRDRRADLAVELQQLGHVVVLERVGADLGGAAPDPHRQVRAARARCRGRRAGTRSSSRSAASRPGFRTRTSAAPSSCTSVASPLLIARRALASVCRPSGAMARTRTLVDLQRVGVRIVAHHVAVELHAQRAVLSQNAAGRSRSSCSRARGAADRRHGRRGAAACCSPATTWPARAAPSATAAGMPRGRRARARTSGRRHSLGILRAAHSGIGCDITSASRSCESSPQLRVALGAARRLMRRCDPASADGCRAARRSGRRRRAADRRTRARRRGRRCAAVTWCATALHLGVRVGRRTRRTRQRRNSGRSGQSSPITATSGQSMPSAASTAPPAASLSAAPYAAWARPRSATRRRTAGESRPVIDDRRDAAAIAAASGRGRRACENALTVSPCSPM